MTSNEECGSAIDALTGERRSLRILLLPTPQPKKDRKKIGPTAFSNFVKSKRAQVLDECPWLHKPRSALIRELSVRWRLLTAEEQDQFKI